MGIIKFTEKANACFYQTAELEKIAGAKGWINVCKEPEKSE